ncbi:MAG: hypothetical protein KC496_16745 [Anaerolineae bacterium]|nr:hypothetical protein [Anaerolineae bacterium]
MTLYAILCHARTGSNLLAGLLNQHPEITGHNELFHERVLFFHNAQIRDEAVIRERDRDPVGYLHLFLKNAVTPAAGFKHLLFNNPTIIEHVIQDNRFKVLLLERENILAQYSSLRIAHQTGQWTLHIGDKPALPEKLAWDAADFEPYMAQYRRAYADLTQRLQASKGDWLHIEYCDLYQAETYRRIFAFLGVETAISLQWNNIRKQNTSQIAQRFQQPYEVHDYLRRNDLISWAQECSQ